MMKILLLPIAIIFLAACKKEVNTLPEVQLQNANKKAVIQTIIFKDTIQEIPFDESSFIVNLCMYEAVWLSGYIVGHSRIQYDSEGNVYKIMAQFNYNNVIGTGYFTGDVYKVSGNNKYQWEQDSAQMLVRYIYHWNLKLTSRSGHNFTLNQEINFMLDNDGVLKLNLDKLSATCK